MRLAARRSLLSAGCAAALLALGATAGHAQATITGRVLERVTNAPLAQAQVSLVGTSVRATTDAEGKYTLRSIPAGTHQVRAVRVGYVELKLEAQVTAGQTTTLDFHMAQSVVQLAEVVTTATGQQRRTELGNSVTTLGDVGAKVEAGGTKNLGDLLVAKAPGVTVLTGNMTGSVPVVRIRGLNSLAVSGSGISNEPIYIVDGVRINTNSINIGTGGTQTSYLNTLSAEEIQDVEIVKGPSAATLYGTDAANGVIVITTKRGRAGQTQWNVYGEGGLVKDRNQYLTQYALWGHTASAPVARCLLVDVGAGTCTVDSTTSYNVFDTPGITPIQTGRRSQYGVQVNGGTDAVRYFASSDFESELGPLKMPDFALSRFSELKVPVQKKWMYPEALSKQNYRANLSATLTPKIELNVNSGFVRLNQRLPQVDNNSFSFIYQAYNNPGYRPDDNHSGLGYSKTGSLGETLNGFRQYSPGEIFQVLRDQTVQQVLGSANVSWRPFSWMQNEGTVGMDLADRTNLSLCRYNECPNAGTTRQGSVTDTHSNDRQFTAKINSTSNWQALSWMTLATTLGADYVNQGSEFAQARGTQLAPGSQTVDAAANKFADNRLPTASKTLGYYAQEQASIRDRLFLTLAARSDQNSAFGTNFQRVFYPKASVSWIVSDENWFPRFDFLNQFRLRSAFGASGVQPGATVSLVSYAPAVVTLTAPNGTSGTDVSGVRADQLGNADLKPERSTEWEGGFESRLFNNRVFLDFTYYTKKTRDAIISQPIAPSAAPSRTSIVRNLASVANSGVELSVQTTVVSFPQFGWDLNVSGSHNNNKVVSLGDGLDGKPNPTIGTGSLRDSVGLPVNAWFFRPYTWDDANHDGYIVASEVTVGPNFEYRGYSQPRDLVSVQSGFDLLRKALRLNVLLDYKGGFGLFNNTVEFYCQQTNVCFTTSNLNAETWDQARLVAQRYKNPSTQGGYLENGQFWRLREISGTVNVPNRWASRYMRARSASLTFAARNLHVWTSYTGTDPESNYSTGDTQTDFSTLAPPSYFTMRLNLHF